MKANEAPEKLYVNFHFIETHPESHQPLVTKQGINKYDIEYTRTDSFIERAAEWLNNFYNKDTHSYLIDEDIEKFINYMKGE